MDAKHLSQRIVKIRGEIAEEAALEFSDQLLELNMESDEPIMILINSPGGEINSGLMMLDAITGSKAPIRMVCQGKAYSILLQYISHLASLTMHDMTGGNHNGTPN